MLKRRVKKIEDKLGAKNENIKFWVLKTDIKNQKQIDDIVAGKTKHHSGSYYSPKDINYFVSREFVPCSVKEKIEGN
jgi:hypothetical protein